MDANENLLDKPLEKAGPRKSKAAFRWKAAGIALAVALGGVWLMRIPIANLAIRGYLDGRGVDASFKGDGLSPVRLEVRNLRLGPSTAPDLTADRAVVELAWNGFIPEVSSVELERPVLKAKLDANGLSFGSLDLFRTERPTEPFELPKIGLTVRNGRVDLATPLGLIVADVKTSGQVDRAFSLEAQARSVAQGGVSPNLNGLAATLRSTIRPDGITANLTGRATGINEAGLVPGWLRSGALTFGGEMRGRPDLSQLSIRFNGSAERLVQDMSGASAVTWDLNIAELKLDPMLAPKGWDGTLRATAAAARAGALTVQAPNVHLALTGRDGKGAGQWTVNTGSGSWIGGKLNHVSAGGDLDLAYRDGGMILNARGKGGLAGGSIAPQQRAVVREILARLEALPIGPLTNGAAVALDRAMQNFRIEAPLGLTWQNGFGELVVPGAVEAVGLGGVRFSLTEHDAQDAPAARVELPSGRTVMSGRAALSGPGLPKLEARVERLAVEPDMTVDSAGVLVVDAWRAGQSSLSLTPVTYRLKQQGETGSLTMTGRARMSGPIPGGRVEDLQLPLDLDARWDKGFVLTAQRACLPVDVGALVLGDNRFGSGTLPLCAADPAGLVRTDAAGRLAGGFVIRTLALGNKTAAGPALSAGPFSLRLAGTTDRPVMNLTLEKAALRMTNGIVVDGGRIEGRLVSNQTGWQGGGTMSGLTVTAQAAGVRANASANWRADLGNTAAPLQISGLNVHLADMAARPRFEPLTLSMGQARVSSERATVQGQMRLAKSNDLLGTIEAQHGFANGRGELTARLTSLTFSPTLQPYQLSEMARGVVENVSGKVGGFVRARWSGNGLDAADGQVDLDAVSMATAALGPIEGVSGRLRFTDLLAPATPPSQTLTIGKINPGIAMENGILRFQLLPDQKLKLEALSWPLAGGRLAVQPTVIALAAPEKRVTLELDSVDLKKFVEQMDMKNFKATGAVEGELPLVITKSGAAIRGGELRAKAGGGTLAYTGQAPGSDANTKLAFDALKNFKFSSIVLTVDGDLAGEISTGIRFEGTSRASISPVSWFRALRARGIPFKFNINIKAPLRALMGSLSGVTDVGGMIKRNVEMELEKEREQEKASQPPAATPPQQQKQPSRRRK